jgi:TonB family protein
VALDRVRTQVLLLHSEQSTLDSLSAGFDDRYTVHCATTGTEALNTLGDTPIHVIVSAKNLPGMSGVEALREAKKRSPDTLGILLADEEDSNLEALVGEQEIFRVIQGGVDVAEVRHLVDDATRQMRLLTLADSANDRAAIPDEPSEHIVMETSENGSSIISDGTGRFPAIDPEKIGAGVSAGARGVDVLVLTRDEEFFGTIQESTRGLHDVHRANTLAEAEKALLKNRVGVAVVDAAMVGDKAEKLTQHLGRKSARLVNIVAGRRDDGEMLMDLINRGKVYRFLLKPVSPGRARLAIEASARHHLEAPDTAFRTKPERDSASQPAKSAAASKREQRQSAQRPGYAQQDLPASGGGDFGQGLSEAFDGDDSSFTQTMTGIVTNLGKALTKKKDAPEQAEARAETVTPATDKAAKDKRASSSETLAARPAAADAPAARKPEKPRPAAVDAAPKNEGRPPLEIMPDDVLPGPGSQAQSAGDGPGIRTYALAAIGAIVIAGSGIAFWLFGGTDDIPPDGSPAVAEERAPMLEAPLGYGSGETTATEAAESYAGKSPEELLDAARLALEEGRIYAPAGSSAVELYSAAADARPEDQQVAAELGAAIDRALGMAETALLESRADDAAAALDSVELVDPANERLPFLQAQLGQMQLRDAIEQARAAIREARFEDAAAALAAARMLGLPDAAEIAAVEVELAEARSEQKVEELLALAATRLEQDSLVAPANDNARYYYQLALSAEPGNPAATQGLQALASKLALKARSEIDAGRFDRAGDILDEAQRLDPDSSELANAAAALADAREQLAAERRAERERAAARQQAAERAAEAEQRAAEAEQRAAAAQDPQPADTRNSPAPGAAAEAAEDSAVDTTGMVAISDLTRTRYVAPKYPRAAERRSLSGWVDVVFTVTADGTTADVEVRNSEPDDIFVNAALRAVERWEFEPVLENGVPVEKQTGVRLMFALE